MIDPINYFRPVFVFASFGWLGVLVAAASIVLALSAIVISLRKSPGGDILITGCVRLQFLICLFWINNSIFFSYMSCSPLNKVGWFQDQTCLIVGVAYQSILLAISHIAGRIGFKRKVEFTILDVLGMTAGTVSVVLNFVIKNIMCTMFIK